MLVGSWVTRRGSEGEEAVMLSTHSAVRPVRPPPFVRTSTSSRTSFAFDQCRPLLRPYRRFAERGSLLLLFRTESTGVYIDETSMFFECSGLVRLPSQKLRAIEADSFPESMLLQKTTAFLLKAGLDWANHGSKHVKKAPTLLKQPKTCSKETGFSVWHGLKEKGVAKPMLSLKAASLHVQIALMNILLMGYIPDGPMASGEL
nr:hypothetical protein Iba_chr08cCG9820 [Ipomoea batatas]